MIEQVGREQRQAVKDDTPTCSGERALPSYVVGIALPVARGGKNPSPSGLEALEKLFDGLRPPTRLAPGIAFVIVLDETFGQQRHADDQSRIEELIRRHTGMAIHPVTEGVLVQRDSIYLIPPGREMIIAAGKLVTTDQSLGIKLDSPGDTFFHSLARDKGDASIAITLLGSNEGGRTMASGGESRGGILAVQKAGGLVIAQSDDSTTSGRSAKATAPTNGIDLCLPPEAIGQALMECIAMNRPDKDVVDEDVTEEVAADNEASHQRISRSEYESRYAPEDLQSKIAELKKSNARLRATNAGLLAANQALSRTNAEHQDKISHLFDLAEDIENLLQASDSATVFLDDQLCIRRSSLRARDVFHIGESDVGQRIDRFEHKLDYPHLFTDLQAVLDGKLPRVKEAYDSEGNPYLVRLNPYGSRHGLNGVLITLVDIALLKAANLELAQSERRFRGTFENAAVGIAHVNLDGSWLEVNGRLCEIVGYSREELLQSSFQDITHHDDLDRDLERLNDLITGKIERYSTEKRYIGKDNKEIWIYLTVSLQRDEADEPLYCISVVQDITKRKNYEREIKQAVEQRDRFLATLSHELRNPLAALLHAARLMDRRRRDAKRGDKPLDVVLRQAQQMSHLLDDLLDISRVTQDKILLNREPCLIREMARDAVEAIQPQLDAKDHKLTMTFPEERYWIDADRARMLQVIENLLTNAVKYTPRGGKIQLEVKPRGEEVLIEVSDTGCGLSPTMLPRVFEMFVQSDENLHDREGGMGLGLTLVRSLVEMHDGTVAADSEGEGRGSTFTVSLPQTTKRPIEPTSDVVAPPPERSKRRNVVLVEDEADAREMLAESLRLDGYQVTPAKDGPEGLAAILDQRPDVALVDIALPGLSGVEIAQQVRKALGPGTVYLVALTGYGRETDRERALAAGFDEHLVKPVRPDELERVLTQPNDGP